MKAKKLKTKPIVLMIANQKGGVGKTTCAIELCTAFSKKGYKVLGIDCDPQNSFSRISKADVKSKNNLKTVLDVKILPSEAIQTGEYYDILPGNEELSDAGSLYGKTNDAWLLSDAIDSLRDNTDYDVIILDSAPGRGRLLEMEYIAADYLIAPTEADTEAESGLFRIRKDILEFSKHNQSHVTFLGYFMNRFRSQTNLHKAMLDNLEVIREEIGANPFKSTIRETVKAGEARINQVSIGEYVKGNGISEDFAALVEEIVERIEQEG